MYLSIRRAPGGVYFALIKSSVTAEEKKIIFAGDKKSAAKKTKRAREASKKNEDWKRKKMATAHKVLECFKKDLATSGKGESEQRIHPPDKNMERREKGVWKDKEELCVDDYVDLDDPTAHDGEDDGELNEGWRNDPDDDHADDYTFNLNMYKQLKRKVSPEESVGENATGFEADFDRTKVESIKNNDELSIEDRIAVEQFETTDDFDCGIDLSCNF